MKASNLHSSWGLYSVLSNSFFFCGNVAGFLCLHHLHSVVKLPESSLAYPSFSNFLFIQTFLIEEIYPFIRTLMTENNSSCFLQ